MKKFIACILLSLLATGHCEARTFGCFAGVLDYTEDRNIEVDYKNYEFLNKAKHNKEFLPFMGCGVTFDF